MTLSEYVKLVGDRIAIAEGRGDRAEVLRLMRLLIETLQEKIPELEQQG